MNAAKIAKYQLRDVLRSKLLIFYAAFFWAATDLLFRFEGGSERVVVSLMNVVLVLVPLVSVVVGTIHVYAAREFVELLLSQPIRRRSLFWGLFLGLAGPLAGGLALGVGLPFAYFGALFAGGAALGLLIGCGVLLTVVFVALGFVVALTSEDRVRGVGVAFGLWLLFAVVYDGLLLLGIHLYADYPLERAVIAASLANPIDLGRILLLLHFDISALMGFTGAVFERFFGSGVGRGVALGALLLWIALPLALGERAFQRKNF